MSYLFCYIWMVFAFIQLRINVVFRKLDDLLWSDDVKKQELDKHRLGAFLKFPDGMVCNFAYGVLLIIMYIELLLSVHFF